MPTPKYKVRPDTGEMQEYLFEYNGILALKNFVARVDGERLILHSAEDMNFSILDALVSEVEINGVVYDNADAAQQALQRLTFNTNRPVIMTQRERELLLGTLQSGNYVGTAADLKALIDTKVDKEASKGLSSNDFTNAYKQQLDLLEDYDIELDESTTELKFKKGNNVVRRISLMFLDDEGTKLVYNKASKNLELRDKRDNLLTSIPVSHFVSNIPTNIVVQNGKIKLMAGNEVIDENVISYNDLADKPDPLLSKVNHSEYGEVLDASRPIKTGEVFLENGNSNANIWADGNELNIGSRNAGGHTTIKTAGYKVQGKGSDDVLLADGTTISKGMLLGREGLERYDWTVTKEYQNRIVFVPRSGFIELHTIEHLGSVSFRKVFAGGQVTFTCDGKQIIYTGDNAFNGGDGSTAVVSVWNNKCYIDIRNI